MTCPKKVELFRTLSNDSGEKKKTQDDHSTTAASSPTTESGELSKSQKKKLAAKRRKEAPTKSEATETKPIETKLIEEVKSTTDKKTADVKKSGNQKKQKPTVDDSKILLRSPEVTSDNSGSVKKKSEKDATMASTQFITVVDQDTGKPIGQLPIGRKDDLAAGKISKEQLKKELKFIRTDQAKEVPTTTEVPAKVVSQKTVPKIQEIQEVDSFSGETVPINKTRKPKDAQDVALDAAKSQIDEAKSQIAEAKSHEAAVAKTVGSALKNLVALDPAAKMPREFAATFTLSMVTKLSPSVTQAQLVCRGTEVLVQERRVRRESLCQIVVGEKNGEYTFRDDTPLAGVKMSYQTIDFAALGEAIPNMTEDELCLPKFLELEFSSGSTIPWDMLSDDKELKIGGFAKSWVKFLTVTVKNAKLTLDGPPRKKKKTLSVRFRCF